MSWGNKAPLGGTPERNLLGKSPENRNLAQFVNAGGKAVLPVREQNYTPKEAAAALRECGIAICAETLRLRAKLPVSHPLHIRRVRGFMSRFYFPESELLRLLSAETEAA